MVTVVLPRGRKQTIVYQITDPQGADPRSFRMTLPQTLWIQWKLNPQKLKLSPNPNRLDRPRKITLIELIVQSLAASQVNRARNQAQPRPGNRGNLLRPSTLLQHGTGRVGRNPTPKRLKTRTIPLVVNQPLVVTQPLVVNQPLVLNQRSRWSTESNKVPWRYLSDEISSIFSSYSWACHLLVCTFLSSFHRRTLCCLD